MEGDVFGDSCFSEQVFVQPPDTVWPIELTRHWGGEHDGVGGMFGVFLDEQIHRLLWQVNCSRRVDGFGLSYLYLAVDASCGFGDAQGFGRQVKVSPEEGHQFTPPDTCG